MFHPPQPYAHDAVPTGVRAMVEANAVTGRPKTGGKRFWTTTELRLLREIYPEQGIEGCLAALPGRSASSIYQRAGIEGLRKLNAAGGVTERRVWTTTPQIDAAITRVYSAKPTIGAVKKLAQTIGRPRAWISNRARALDLIVPRFKEEKWSEAEIAMVREHGHKHPDVVRRIMMKAGFRRTATAIKLKAKHFRIAREVDENVFSGRGLGEVLGVDSGVIATWIERGWLKAKRRPTSPGTDSGKGAWMIRRKDIRAFIIENVGLVDFRKVDKHWLVDLLAEQERAKP